MVVIYFSALKVIKDLRLLRIFGFRRNYGQENRLLLG